VNYGGITIAGVPYAFTSDGVVAGGSPVPVPGLPAAATDLLKTLGISIEMPKPQVTQDGASATAAAQGLTITIDTAPLRSKLPSLPLGDLVMSYVVARATVLGVLRGGLVWRGTTYPTELLRGGRRVDM
jgi:hypothetical protein